MLQDYKLGLRMLLKYPGLTIAGGLALAFAIGVGAGTYDLLGKVMAPAIPLPGGDRIVLVATQNTRTNAAEPRVARDFLEWRRELRTIEDLGAYRTTARNLLVGDAAPVLIQVAETTAAAFRTARVPPLLGRPLLDADEIPGAPNVVLLGYDAWQRSLGARPDVVGSVVKLGNTPATVIGVMPEGFKYPVNHQAWMPLQLRTEYGALEGGAIEVIGRLAPGATGERADAELRVLGDRAAAALPATHEHLRARVTRLGGASDDVDLVQLALRNLAGLLILMVACMNVGTLFYARTATREGEIALRSALGASRARIVVQLFVEALVLASIAAAAGLVAADRTLKWGIEAAYAGKGGGGAPFWMTAGLELTTVLYASGLAVICAAMLSLLPALRVTRSRVQPHLANLGTGGATLRFGRVWTGAMIAQVLLTTMAIPVAMESASQSMQMWRSRAAFPSGEYLSARVDVERPFDEETPLAFEERRARTFAALERRLAQEPGVVAVTFADRVPGVTRARTRTTEVETWPGSHALATSAVAPGFFEAFERSIVAGRGFHDGDRSPAARTVIVNEAFARDFRRQAGRVSPIGARLRYVAPASASDAGAQPAAGDASADPWLEIVGVVRDFGLDPGEDGSEQPFVFRAASAGTVSPLVMSVRVRGNPAPLVPRLPVVAAGVDAGLYVREARPLNEWIKRQHSPLMLAAQAAVTALVLFLSALAIFSLMSVSVSRRTREIGLRMALGAPTRHVLAETLSRAMALLGSGVAAGGVLLLWGAWLAGPSGKPADDLAQFTLWLGATAAVMTAAGLLACVGPARRALRINPIDALRES